MIDRQIWQLSTTGEVAFFSEYDDPDEQEKLAAEIDGNSHYVRIERIPSFQAYVVDPRSWRQAIEMAGLSCLERGSHEQA